MDSCVTESGVQLFRRVRSNAQPSLENLSPEIIPQHGPRQKEIIEISGESNTGKTYQLMELIALTVLPKEFGGKGAGAIVIDNNSNFHVPNTLERIIEKHLLHHKMSTSLSNETEDLRQATGHVQDAVFCSLDRVHLFKCYTSTDLELAMLHASMLLDENLNISLIAMDSITSFYWCESKMIRMDVYVAQILKVIKKMCDEYGTIAVYTKLPLPSEAINHISDLIQYKIHVKQSNDKFEATTSYNNQIYKRSYTINSFGINWLSSDA